MTNKDSRLIFENYLNAQNIKQKPINPQFEPDALHRDENEKDEEVITEEDQVPIKDLLQIAQKYLNVDLFKPGHMAEIDTDKLRKAFAAVYINGYMTGRPQS